MDYEKNSKAEHIITNRTNSNDNEEQTLRRHHITRKNKCRCHHRTVSHPSKDHMLPGRRQTKQKFGMALGSSVTPILRNVHMGDFEGRAIATYDLKPKM